jgi:hypothetical protein
MPQPTHDANRRKGHSSPRRANGYAGRACGSVVFPLTRSCNGLGTGQVRSVGKGDLGITRYSGSRPGRGHSPDGEIGICGRRRVEK